MDLISVVGAGCHTNLRGCPLVRTSGFIMITDGPEKLPVVSQIVRFGGCDMLMTF